MGSAKTEFQFVSSVGNKNVDVTIFPVYKKAGTAVTKSSSSKKTDSLSSDKVVWSAGIDKGAVTELSDWANEEQFNGSKNTILKVRSVGKQSVFSSRWVLLAGLGEEKSFLPKYWGHALIAALKKVLQLKGVKTVQVNLPAGSDTLCPEVALSLLVDAVYQCTYQSREAKKADQNSLPTVIIGFSESTANTKALEKQLKPLLEQAISLAEARSTVKDLVNHPANLKCTNTLLEEAKGIAKASTVSLTTKSDIKWLEKNMPCFFEVARGSLESDSPKFIHLHYSPKSGAKAVKAKKQIALVGKSVIFDTGGYQVKPGNYMNTMKGDMTGGAVVLGVMQALAALNLQHLEIHVYLAATPNKINSSAMIPDSIVNTTCGKTVEIRHTDAEGRLTLIDAVTKAAETKPDEIITIATLTGSASQAVGRTIALMGNNEALRDRIAVSGKKIQEPVQTLDVTDEDFDDIKSGLDGADIRNTSKQKYRGAQSAAAFVMSGAPEGLPMAHLDIAGADMTNDEKATGISVRAILQYLIDENDRLATVPVKTAKGKSVTKKTSKK